MRKRISLASAVLCAGASLPAMAQTDAAPAELAAADTGEIIVTALKGNATVQQAPTTVKIVTGELIAEQGLTSVESLQAVVPGIRIQQAPGGAINPVVRGIGTSPSSRSFEQSIGLFVDGIYSGRSRDYAAALFDVDRIELLKGTQAAVVGKNTSLGALSLTTKKAVLGVLGYELVYGHEFERQSDNINGSVNIPLGDEFAVRAAFLYDDTGGYIKNTLTGEESGATKRNGVRVGFRWQPNDAFDWTAYGQYAEYKQFGQYFHVGVDRSGNAVTYARSIGDPGYFVAPYTTRETPRPGYVPYGLSETGSRLDAASFNSTIKYDLGWATITAVTGYGRYDDTFLLDGGGFIGLPITIAGREYNNAFSQELRISSNGNSALSYVVGAYYYKDKWQYDTIYDWNQAALPAGGLGGATFTRYIQRANTISVFGNLGYRISEAFRLNGSLRYEHFKKSAFYDRVPIRAGGLTTVLYPDFDPTEFKDAKDYVDYSLQAQYFITPDKMLYVSYATGTKGFGYHNGPRLPSDGPYRTENTTTLEVGAKIGFGRRSHLNVAYFRTDIDDYQIGINLGPSFVIRNDDVRVQGAEAELALAVTPEFNLSASVTYTDAKKRGTLPANSIPNLPYSPKWSGLVRAAYDAPLNDRLNLSLSADVEFRSSQQLSDTVSFLALIPESPGYAKLNLRAGLEDRKTGLGVAVVARNVTNKYVVNYGFPTSFVPGAATIAEDPPRTIMLQFSIKR